MATLTERNKDRISFETTCEERIPGFLLLSHGAVFLGLPFYALTQQRSTAVPVCVLLGLMVLVGLVEGVCGLNLLLKTEWLAVDLRRRTYAGRYGFLLWGRKWAGPLEHFEQIRLRDVPCGRRGRHRRWVIEWEWGQKGRRPFRVTGRGRLKSFRLAPDRQMIGNLDFLLELQGIARDVSLPLILPEHYLEGLGVGDLELDDLA